jgi:hypothetical protein
MWMVQVRCTAFFHFPTEVDMKLFSLMALVNDEPRAGMGGA